MRFLNRSQTLVEAVDLGVGATADLRHLALGALADLAAQRRPWRPRPRARPGRPRASSARFSTSASRRFVDLLLLDGDLAPRARAGRGCRASSSTRGDHVGREVDDLLEVLRRQVEQVAQAARDALEVPDVRDRRGQLDVAHPLTTHLGAGDLDAAALADDALEAHALVLAAVALPVPGRTEDLLAEEPVLLGLEGAVVDGLGLLDLAVRPRADVVGGGQADAQLVEEVDVEHCGSFFRWFVSRPSSGMGRRAALAPATAAAVRPLRRCSARAGTGRCRAPPPRGRRPRRCHASRWTCRRWRAPRR